MSELLIFLIKILRTLGLSELDVLRKYLCMQILVGINLKSMKGGKKRKKQNKNEL